MCVEGTKAGEEKAVGSIDKREATHVRPSAALETGINKEVVASRDNLRLKRLEQELGKIYSKSVPPSATMPGPRMRRPKAYWGSSTHD